MKLITIVSLLAVLFINVDVEAQKISLQKVKEFELPDGYTCNSLSGLKNEIVITCPSTVSFFHSEDGEELKEVPFKMGRGPGELGRGPFGIGILKDHIVFSDPDLQRMLIYDKKKDSFYVKRPATKEGLSYIYSTDNNQFIFLRTNSLKGIGYAYDLYADQYSEFFELKEPFKNTFMGDGKIAASGNKLLFGSYHEGYVSVWDFNTQKELEKHQLFVNKNLKERPAQMNGLSGFIPPNSANKIYGLGLYKNNKGEDMIVVLIKSNTDEYELDKLYVYDTQKKRITTDIKLEYEADKIYLDSKFLYVHYEGPSKLVKYKLVEK